mgnify:CR=1 FL=1
MLVLEGLIAEFNLISREKEHFKCMPLFFNSHVITFSFRIHMHLFRIILQILYKAKDLDSEPRSQTVRGNHTQSCLLSGLRKYVLYEIRVLAFTRIGDGVPSSPALTERTKDDGKCMGYQNKGLT